MKIGKFSLTHCLIQNNHKDLYKLFGKIIVTRAESNYVNQIINYEGISELFREIKEGEMIPWYTFCIDSNKDITVEEVNDLESCITSYRWSSF